MAHTPPSQSVIHPNDKGSISAVIAQFYGQSDNGLADRAVVAMLNILFAFAVDVPFTFLASILVTFLVAFLVSFFVSFLVAVFFFITRPSRNSNPPTCSRFPVTQSEIRAATTLCALPASALDSLPLP